MWAAATRSLVQSSRLQMENSGLPTEQLRGRGRKVDVNSKRAPRLLWRVGVGLEAQLGCEEEAQFVGLSR